MNIPPAEFRNMPLVRPPICDTPPTTIREFLEWMLADARYEIEVFARAVALDSREMMESGDAALAAAGREAVSGELLRRNMWGVPDPDKREVLLGSMYLKMVGYLTRDRNEYTSNAMGRAYGMVRDFMTENPDMPLTRTLTGTGSDPMLAP